VDKVSIIQEFQTTRQMLHEMLGYRLGETWFGLLAFDETLQIPSFAVFEHNIDVLLRTL